MKIDIYFLFGRPGVKHYLSGDLDLRKISEIKRMIQQGIAKVYQFNPNDPFELLNEFIGFDEYIELNKEEFDVLKIN